MFKLKYYQTFINRSYSSALYITGDKAQQTFVVLTPFIDFNGQIQNKSSLIQNIEARKLNIDLNKIEKRWSFFKMIDEQKNMLEFTRDELFNVIKQLKDQSVNNSNDGDIEKLQTHMTLIRNDLKNIKDFSYGLEEDAALGVLNLPNILHLKTPLDNEVVIYSFLTKPENQSKSHLEIAKNCNFLDFHNPMIYYLKSDAALFELSVTNYFRKFMLNLNYIQFSNADFVRSIVIEGCGTAFTDNKKILTLEDPHDDKCHDLSRLHLVGGASLYSFMAYFTKNFVFPKYFPIKCFALGRNYQAIDNNERGLFNVNQQTVLKKFVALLDDESVDNVLEESIKEIIQLYEPLGYHFRLVYIPAYNLLNNESLRLSIQMFSNYLQSYVEVGNLSLYDEYLTKRLLFTYKSDKDRKFPKIIAGKVLNVQKMLGCILENNLSNNKNLLSNHLLQCDV